MLLKYLNTRTLQIATVPILDRSSSVPVNPLGPASLPTPPASLGTAKALGFCSRALTDSYML